jgi:nickel-dependent lactate racemase
VPDTGFTVPWGAWGSEVVATFAVPDDWEVVHLAMRGAPALDEDGIAARIDSPIGSDRLEDLAGRSRSAVIAVDDLTRPTRAGPIVSAIISRLERGGLSASDVVVLIASGAHAPLSEAQCRQKLGDVGDRVRVVSHSQAGPFAPAGASLAGVPVQLNEAFLRADLRIGVGAVIPHPFAGFSGGGKVVVPGLADLDVLARTHKFGLMGLTGGRDLDTNRFRSAMEATVRGIGLHFTVNVVVNALRDTCGVFCGDMVDAHRAAAAFARHVGSTPLPATPCDALVLNAYPKDNELLQVEAALVALQQGLLGAVTDRAPVVLAASCEFGLGHHGLFGPGGRLFRTPVSKGLLGKRPMLVFAPGCTVADAALAFWDGYPHCGTWSEVVSRLTPLLPLRPRVAVAPCAPLQVADDEGARG